MNLRSRRSANTLWLVSHEFPPDEGGIQTYARAVALGYMQLGWHVYVFTKTSLGPRRVVENGLTIVDVGDGSRRRVSKRLAWQLSLAWFHALLKGQLPSAVHACTWRSALFARRLHVALHVAPLTVTVHGREISLPRSASMRRMRRVLASATRIVAVSAWTRRQLLARAPELEPHSVVAWNGTSDFVHTTERRSAQHNPEPIVLSVCRLVPRKNLHTAIAAAHLCTEKGFAFRYLIAGRGPEMAALQAKIQAFGLEDRIQLLGFVPDAELVQLYAKADVFLHPQLELEDGAEMEGFGISIADAMAYGIACIVGANGGPGEIVTHNVTGHLVDARSVADVAASLTALLENREEREQLGSAAQQWSREHFRWERHCLRACGAPVTVDG